MLMLNWLKLSHPDHSGRLRPHEHTSYLPLGVLLLLVGFILTIYSVSAASPPPIDSSVGLTGTMPGPAPTIAATIAQPSDQQHFSTSPITVKGSCPQNTVIEVFKNDIFGGSTLCNSNGTYSIDVDLLFGKNTLIVRVFDALNQPGPDSTSLTVFYDVLPPQTSPLSALSFSGAQLLLNTDAIYRGVFPDKEFNMPVDILGGTPPYAVNVQWGDSNNKVVPRADNATFRLAHAYRKPGTYQISLQATDSTGRVAFLGVAAIVNGQPSSSAAGGANGSGSSGPSGLGQVLALWPVYTSLVAIVISFWLGERREKRIIHKQAAVLPS